MVERAVAAWEQLCLSQIFDDTVRHAPLVDSGPILFAVQFRLTTAFAITHISTLHYCSGADQDRADRSSGTTPCHSICVTARMEMNLLTLKVLLLSFLRESQELCLINKFW